jgi:acyl carrier protein
VEKSELDVLNGIEEGDWDKIRQIVMEVDSKQNLDSIRSLLKRRGYELAVDQDPLLRNTQLSYVYAIRPSKAGRLIVNQEEGSHIRPLPLREKSQQITITEIRSFMRSMLPEFMIPTAFAIMNKLPLTPNGKIDYKALPVPGTERPDIEEVFVAPSTHTEEVLERIFARTLRIEQVGIHDSFFDIGGDSLLATRAISQIQDAFIVELTHGTLFQSDTIAELAKIIDGILKDSQNVQAPPILPVARDKAKLDDTYSLLTNLGDLSDEEVNSLLRNMLSEGGEN